jgi:HTH-type transcriptional regulator / antitoxin HigA
MNSPIINEYTPDRVAPPGDTLQEVLDDRDMSQVELADRTGRSKKMINEIIKGKAPITADTAIQLERVLGVPATFWSNLERNYQDWLARKQEEELLRASTGWVREMPVRFLEQQGWIEERSSKPEKVRELLNYFGVASPAEWRQVFAVPQASFRHSVRFQSDPGALAAWLRAGELEAQRIRCGEFDREGFQCALRSARALTTTGPDEFVPRLTELCAGVGVAVAFVREVPRSRASGATRWISSSKALIQLSLRYKTDDHLWFTFFHEAGHILLHGKRLVFIEEGKASTGQEEEEANRFAADLLIPPEALAELRPIVVARRLSKERVLGFARELGIAPGIVVGRLQHEGWLPHSYLNGLKLRLEWAY